MTTVDDLNFCTIISKNYLAFARVLAKSLRVHHPNAKIYVLLVDHIDGYFDPKQEPFELFLIDELPIPQLSRFCFQYHILELNTAAKPYFLNFLFHRFNMNKLVYLDPDILVYQPMTQLNHLLDDAAIALTPHILIPADDKGAVSDRDILSAGVYNLGFIGLSNKKACFQLLKWWQEKLFKHCLHQPNQHYMVDQRWIDLAPSFFKDLLIFRNDAYNVAYWNLHERKLTYSGEVLFANDTPCVFLHFSGFNPQHPSRISKYQIRFKMSNLGEGALAYKHYAKELLQEGYEECSKWPYAFNYFDNGNLITKSIRDLYRELDDHVVNFGDPFKTNHSNSFFIYYKYQKPNLQEECMHGLNVIGMFHSEKGTGQAVRCIYRSLKEWQIPCSLLNFDCASAKNNEKLDVMFSEDNPFKVNLINFNADTPLRHVTSDADQLMKDHYNIGYWNWELETFPDFWLKAFSSYDEIWVPSTFTQKSIQSKSPIPVVHLPYSIDIPDLPEHLSRSYFGLDEDKFTFLFVFDCDSFIARKNPFAVIKAFKQAFGNQKDVQLVIKMSHSKNFELEKFKKISQEQKNIIIFDAVHSREDSYGLINVCDAFVSLHRSEGFGFNICEAMAMGKPVIATNYSANTDYMNAYNSYLVEYQKVAIDQDYGPYKKAEMWAEPNIQHAAFLMKHIKDNRDEATRKGLEAQKTMKDHYSDKIVGQKIKTRMDVIYDMLNNSKLPFDKTKFDSPTNIVDYPIRSDRLLIGQSLIFLRKIGKWLIKPALEKQSRVNDLQNIHLRELIKKIEQLEEKIEELRKNHI